MKKTGKLTDDELKSVKSQQSKLSTIIQEIGVVEARKHALLHDVASINEAIEITKKDLEKTYGSISIDLESGNWTKIDETPNV
tara:strand:- start:815 stop:1063 length:249 start_codon:yes stop_codon:yes gene_type:complete